MVAAIGCVAGDASLLSVVAVGHVLTVAGPAGLIAVPVVVSVVRLSVVGWAGQRIARLRAAVN